MKHFLLTIFIALISANLSAQALADPSLEASGPSNTPWTSTSSNFGTSFCDGGCGTCGGPCVPNTGSWYAWFGGTSSAEIGDIAQTFNAATTGIGILTYQLKVPMKGAAGDTLFIQLDGVTVSKINTDDSIGTYQLMTVDVGPVTSGSHNLTIRFEKQASASAVNVLVDDIQLVISGVGVEEIDFSDGIQISNNPESKKIMVAYNFNKLQNVRLVVTDLTGKVVYNNTYENQQTSEHSISSQDWNSGLYNVTLTSDKGLSKTTKVVVY